jgi:hypothetical protein
MNVLQTLKYERDRLQKDLNRLNGAINVLGGSTGRTTASNRPALSAAARTRIHAAQRARWAKVRANSAQKQSVVTMPANKKKTMSPAARQKIAAAQRARWAKVRAKKGKAK